jgi:hypothetical protein
MPVPHTPNRGICSEDVALLVYPALDLREAGQATFDETTPNSIWRAWQLIKRKAALKQAVASVFPIDKSDKSERSDRNPQEKPQT